MPSSPVLDKSYRGGDITESVLDLLLRGVVELLDIVELLGIEPLVFSHLHPSVD